VTENIIFGQLAPYGTGCFDVLMDTNMVKESNEVQYEQDEPKDFVNQLQQLEDFGTPIWQTPK